MRSATTLPDSTVADRLQLRPGTCLLTAPDGSLVILDGREDPARIELDERDVRLAVDVLTGREPRLAAEQAHAPEDVDAVVKACVAEGLAVASVAAPPAPAVTVLGTGVLAQWCAELLAADDTGAVQHVDCPPERAADIVGGAATGGVYLCCADLLPDSAWRAVDQAARRSGASWLPVHGEFDQLAAGPLCTAEPDALGYADLRFRRLAAALAPRELRACWESWEQGTALVRPAGPSRETVLVAGAHLRRAVRATAAEPDSLHHHQLLVGADLTVSRHPVLPAPAGRE